MRKILFSLLAVAAVVSTATLTAPRADAMTIGSAAAIQALIQETNAIEDIAVVCRHRAFSSRQRCVTVMRCRHRVFSSRRVCY